MRINPFRFDSINIFTVILREINAFICIVIIYYDVEVPESVTERSTEQTLT